jgi:signal transduction histidine kinase
LRLRAELVEDEETRDRLVATVDEMQRMVEATLDFVRAEAGREETREVDLSALVGALGEDLRELGHKISVKPSERCVIRGRSGALRRALRNVIENAATYGKQATVTVACDADQARVTVTDRGPGIPEKDLQRVFEPFVRGEESRSRETGGIGLGLAIARTIVRGHGGDVQLANGEKKGLVATISLPRMVPAGKI